MTNHLTAKSKPSPDTKEMIDMEVHTAKTSTVTTTTTNAKEKPVWTRLNHKGIYHDNRRLLKHRAKNCECFVCYREIYKLPPAETREEQVEAIRCKMKEREIKRTKRLAKKDIKNGKQRTIDQFFQAS